MPLRSNLKALADARGVSIREISRDINYRFESVRQLYNDEMERFPRELLARLCVYFNVSLSELLTLEET
ncbi:helix-turn-helix transcriptional regulator [Brevibacillus laterosporus]|uniref:helix-turn-helix domain-containing protein n=1 Tax=Bacillales TaxID=1385 RepID=UPI000F8EA0BF|nr:MULTISPECIES: helix-turn-helix transcriptional regulator [Bacillales]MCR8938782.1 helix-turn-helix transcriptional regulator [Brevibacillus laterosporus]MCZ0841422.1 helix-turn-helix transcriptional regulator [Brevibacillus laterosporus]MCZ0847794.1 helix-turn-helix transcriptional regulator [Brevibacillus laterosporus]RUR59897.1 XRE family transcriptional regulator [Bacillus sp. VKPM B-3276]